MSIDPKTLRKLEGLFAKEGDTGATPAEAAAALGIAQRIMDREGISRAQLELAGQALAEQIEESTISESTGGTPAWLQSLSACLAKANGCYIYRSGTRLQIVGRTSGAESTRYLFALCCREVNRLARRHATGRGRTYANQFRHGCVDAIRQAIAVQRAEANQAARAAVSGSELVALDNALASVARYGAESEVWARAKHRLGKGGHRTRSDSGARAHGRSAGAGIYPGSGARQVRGGSLRLGSGS